VGFILVYHYWPLIFHRIGSYEVAKFLKEMFLSSK
jgi:hypothetical protein